MSRLGQRGVNSHGICTFKQCLKFDQNGAVVSRDFGFDEGIARYHISAERAKNCRNGAAD